MKKTFYIAVTALFLGASLIACSGKHSKCACKCKVESCHTHCEINKTTCKTEDCLKQCSCKS